MIELIDISHHQGEPDFDRVIADGICGVICKAIDGRLPDIDRQFERNWSEMIARRDRIVIGSYAFARPQSDGGGAEDGRIEAEHYARVMLAAEHDGDWIAVVDLERGGMDPDHSAQMNIDFLAAWVETCERLLGRSPWIYTGKHTWREGMAWTSQFDHLPLWQADYTSTPAEMPWPRTLWQYTGMGSVDGITGNVDRNRFYGTMADLRELARPTIYTRLADATGGIHASFDLAATVGPDPNVRLVQGALLAHGHGPDGLVGRDGLPDGYAGAKTLAHYADFCASRGLAGTVVDGAAWWWLSTTPRE